MYRADAAKLRERLRSWFPDREFFMRSQGQVRFIKVSSRLQITAASIVAAALVVWAATMVSVAVSQFISQRDRLALLEREAKVESAESRVAAYRGNLDEASEDLTKRMQFLEGAMEAYDLPETLTEDTVSDSSSEAAKTVAKVSAALPEAAALVRIEARQLAFVEKLTRFADQRAARAAVTIRKLGLDPKQMMNATPYGQGGPLELLSSESDGSIDPRFERLGLSLARMDALERGLESVPQVLPARKSSISSGFGYRSDPFTGRAAMHSGLDFAAGYGAPVHAAANGRVSFVGVKSGYGNVVEITHGNGMMTRYAHLSGFRTKAGQQVEAGALIGAIGSSGRSTGPHLHFEVRINGRAVNPRPFLEKTTRVLEEARGNTAASRR